MSYICARIYFKECPVLLKARGNVPIDQKPELDVKPASAYPYTVVIRFNGLRKLIS
jgi:hypothetical protein